MSLYRIWLCTQKRNPLSILQPCLDIRIRVRDLDLELGIRIKDNRSYIQGLKFRARYKSFLHPLSTVRKGVAKNFNVASIALTTMNLDVASITLITNR